MLCLNESDNFFYKCFSEIISGFEKKIEYLHCAKARVAEKREFQK